MEYEMSRKTTSEALVKDIKRKTRKKYSSEEKIRIILDGLKGETTIAELSLKNRVLKKSYDGLEKGSGEL